MDHWSIEIFGQLFAPAAVACGLALALTPLVRSAFLRLRIVDMPDGRRKIHETAVPRVGGIPIAISYIIALSILPVIHSAASPWREDQRLVTGLIAASAIVFLTGLADDLFGLRPWQKLAGETIAAATVCFSGVHIASLGGRPVADWVGVPLTMVWLAVCTNAFNLIDGLDGLAAGMGLFATLTMFVAALLNGGLALALVTVPLAGSLIGFLRYNFNPASVFLGDSGSLLVGFLLGSYAVIWSQKSATLLGLAAPVMVLAVPLLDVCLAISRRWLRGQPIFRADRSHIHHKLLERGLTHRSVVLLLYGISAACAGLSLLQSFAPERLAVLVVVAFCCAVWAGVNRLGYPEFQSARRALGAISLRRSIRGDMAMEVIEHRINAAASVDECWEAVRQAATQAGFSQMEANLCGRLFQSRTGRVRPNSCWQLRVPLGDLGYVEVGKEFAVIPEYAALSPFVEMLQAKLLTRLVDLHVRNRESRPTDTAALVQLAEALHRENRSAGKPVAQ